MEEKLFQNFEGVVPSLPQKVGRDSTERKKKLKSDRNIRNFLLRSVVFTLGWTFFKNIANNLQARSHFGHLNKEVFSQKFGAVSFYAQ